ncbi:MAG: apolipoprotein N-acyltransferase [Candidatus Melainabacteria bacterium]|nr:apolipoprotein N-acyltransferase [Candidatus Melainabacteria bacterium]
MLSNPVIKILLITFCGFLLSFSAPEYNLWLVAWIGLTPLFIIINTAKKIKEGIFYSFLFGFGYNFWYLHWLFSMHPLDWLGLSNTESLILSYLALFITSVYCSLYFVLFTICVFLLKQVSVKPFNNSILKLILTTFIWLIVFNKLLSCKYLPGFPWTLVEYSQYKNLFLIQIAEYFGSVSISFLIVIFNLVLAEFLIWIFSSEKIGDRHIPKTPGGLEVIINGFIFVLTLIFISLITGFFLYERNQQQFSNESQAICLLQGNLPIKTTRGAKVDLNLAKQTYEELLVNNEAALFISPEGSLPTVFNKNPSVQSWLKSIVNKKKASVIFGTYCNKQNSEFTNCIASILPGESRFSFYEKERLVPFGEFVPFSYILPNILKKLASFTIGEGFVEGKKISAINSSIGKLGMNICFELIFPSLIRKYSLQKAGLLVNLSDLSWFSNSRIKEQFLAFAAFRAIENRKPFVICANNGISAFIDPSGKIKSQSLQNTRGVLIDWINPNYKVTLYAKYGW